MKSVQYCVKLEIEHNGWLFERDVGPFMSRDRAERVLEKAIGTIALWGVLYAESRDSRSPYMAATINISERSAHIIALTQIMRRR